MNLIESVNVLGIVVLVALAIALLMRVNKCNQDNESSEEAWGRRGWGRRGWRHGGARWGRGPYGNPLWRRPYVYSYPTYYPVVYQQNTDCFGNCWRNNDCAQKCLANKDSKDCKDCMGDCMKKCY